MVSLEVDVDADSKGFRNRLIATSNSGILYIVDTHEMKLISKIQCPTAIPCAKGSNNDIEYTQFILCSTPIFGCRDSKSGKSNIPAAIMVDTANNIFGIKEPLWRNDYLPVDKVGDDTAL